MARKVETPAKKSPGRPKKVETPVVEESKVEAPVVEETIEEVVETVEETPVVEETIEEVVETVEEAPVMTEEQIAAEMVKDDEEPISNEERIEIMAEEAAATTSQTINTHHEKVLPERTPETPISVEDWHYGNVRKIVRVNSLVGYEC